MDLTKSASEITASLMNRGEDMKLNASLKMIDKSLNMERKRIKMAAREVTNRKQQLKQLIKHYKQQQEEATRMSKRERYFDYANQGSKQQTFVTSMDESGLNDYGSEQPRKKFSGKSLAQVRGAEFQSKGKSIRLPLIHNKIRRDLNLQDRPKKQGEMEESTEKRVHTFLSDQLEINACSPVICASVTDLTELLHSQLFLQIRDTPMKRRANRKRQIQRSVLTDYAMKLLGLTETI